MGSVLKIIRITPSPLKPLLGEYNLSRVKTVQWGVDNEEKTIKAFTLRTGKTVKETGIWTSQDGVDNKIVLEVKCQYTERNVSIEEAVKSAAWWEWARL